MAPISVCLKLLLAATLLAAPAAQAQKAAAPQAAIFAAPVEAGIEEAPADIAAATLAVAALLRGLPDAALPPEIGIEPGVADKLREPQVRFEGFDLEGFHLAYVGPSRHGKSGRRIAGSLFFVDAGGRQAEQGFAVDFVARPGGGLLIKEALGERRAPQQPRILMYAVPASRVPQNFFENLRPFGELLAWLEEKSIRPGTLHSTRDPYHVFALSLDRLAAGDRITIDADQTTAAQSLLDIDGWQVAVRRLPPSRGFVAKAGYRSGKTGRAAADLATLAVGAPPKP